MTKTSTLKLSFKTLLLSGLFFLFQSNSIAAIYYVKASGGNDASAGTSWATAFSTFQKALDVAVSGDEIWLSSGTYVPSKNTAGTSVANARDNTFYITKNIKVYGGFAGTETNISQRVSSNVTTLSGDMDNDNDLSDNAYHVVYLEAIAANGNITNNCVLDGFTVTKGNANGGSFAAFGSGLFIISIGVREISPLINGCKFTGNSGQIGGGVAARIIGSTSNITFSNCIISQNTTSNTAAGIYVGGSGSTSLNYLFTACRFTSNLSLNYGGAINFIANDGTNALQVTNSIFENNGVTNSFGGAMNINELYPAGITASITNCTFYANTSAGYAGGINFLSSADPNDPSLTNPIVATVKNCVFWQNTAFNSQSHQYADIFNVDNNNITASYSIIRQNSGFTSGSGVLANQDPKFVDGPGGDFRLLSGSPAIDAGTSSGAPTIDYAGNSRPQGSGYDMGAYEGTVVVLPVTLTAFTAKADLSAVLLSWQTASEQNNDYYLLERSGDGKTFTPVAKLYAKTGGQSSTSLDYSYRDAAPFSGVNYYQLY